LNTTPYSQKMNTCTPVTTLVSRFATSQVHIPTRTNSNNNDDDGDDDDDDRE